MRGHATKATAPRQYQAESNSRPPRQAAPLPTTPLPVTSHEWRTPPTELVPMGSHTHACTASNQSHARRPMGPDHVPDRAAVRVACMPCVSGTALPGSLDIRSGDKFDSLYWPGPAGPLSVGLGTCGTLLIYATLWAALYNFEDRCKQRKRAKMVHSEQSQTAFGARRMHPRARAKAVYVPHGIGGRQSLRSKDNHAPPARLAYACH